MNVPRLEGLLVWPAFFAAILAAATSAAERVDCTCLEKQCAATRIPQNQVWFHPRRGEVYQDMERADRAVSGGGRIRIVTGVVGGVRVRLDEKEFRCVSSAPRLERERLETERLEAERERIARFASVKHRFGCDPENLWRWESLDGLLRIEPDLESCLTRTPDTWILTRKGHAAGDPFGDARQHFRSGSTTRLIAGGVHRKGENPWKMQGQTPPAGFENWVREADEFKFWVGELRGQPVGLFQNAAGLEYRCERGGSTSGARINECRLPSAPTPHGRVPLPPGIASPSNFSVFYEEPPVFQGTSAQSVLTPGYWTRVGRQLPSRQGLIASPIEPVENETRELPIGQGGAKF